MAFVDFAASTFGSLIDDAYALIAPSVRSIGGIIPDCTVEEHHYDRLMITEHPVETGAAITDHSFRNPSEVMMKIGFSNSTAGSEGWVQEAYQLLLSLQQAREPFDVFTGKRAYSNMLVEILDVVTDPTSEYALMCSVTLREIILTSTAQTSTNAPQSAQATPDQTSSVGQAGSQQIGTTNGVPTFAQTSTIQSGAGAGGDFSSIQGEAGFAPSVAGFTSTYPDFYGIAPAVTPGVSSPAVITGGSVGFGP